MWQKVIWIAAAGALGTLARYGLAGFAHRACERLLTVLVGPTAANAFPWGTLTVNTLGCFLFGIGWSIMERGVKIDSHVQLAVFTGFLGALTTFSSYSFENRQMIRYAQWPLLTANIVAHNGLGLVAVMLGLMLGRS